MDFLIDPSLRGSRRAARELWLVTQADWPRWLEARDAATRAWLAATGFKAERQQLALMPRADGSIAFGRARARPACRAGDALDLWHVAGLPERLPAGTTWRIANRTRRRAAATTLALGWAYGSYRFDAYKSAATARPATARARLVAPAIGRRRPGDARRGRHGDGPRPRQHAGVRHDAGAARGRSDAGSRARTVRSPIEIIG